MYIQGFEGDSNLDLKVYKASEDDLYWAFTTNSISRNFIYRKVDAAISTCFHGLIAASRMIGEGSLYVRDE